MILVQTSVFKMFHYIFLISMVVLAAESAVLPFCFSKCSKNDPELNKCLTESAIKAWPTIVKGGKLSYLQNVNPFYVSHLHIPVDENLLMGNLTASIITGLAEMKIKEVNMDVDKKKLNVKFTIPYLNFNGGYEVAGRLLFFPIEGEGPSNITFTDMENDLHINFDIIDKDGHQFIEIKNSSMTYTTKRAYFHLENLFGGDAILGEAINRVLDESWQAVNEEIGKRLGHSIGAAYAQLLQTLFRKVPLEEFFLE